MPVLNFGKVKVGQDVNIKLDSYPYFEFGILKGKVGSISVVPSEEVYLNIVELPNGLLSDLGNELIFSEEMSGRAEIITKKRKLLSRLYYKLEYLFR